MRSERVVAQRDGKDFRSARPGGSMAGRIERGVLFLFPEFQNFHPISKQDGDGAVILFNTLHNSETEFFVKDDILLRIGPRRVERSAVNGHDSLGCFIPCFPFGCIADGMCLPFKVIFFLSTGAVSAPELVASSLTAGRPAWPPRTRWRTRDVDDSKSPSFCWLLRHVRSVLFPTVFHGGPCCTAWTL